MKGLMLKLEPLIWVLFGAGMLVAALVFPAWVAVVGLAAPLGLVPEGALEFERAHALAANPLGRLVLLAAIALPLWAGAHHLRHVVIDLGGVAHDAWVGSLFYATALIGSLFAILAVARL